MLVLIVLVVAVVLIVALAVLFVVRVVVFILTGSEVFFGLFIALVDFVHPGGPVLQEAGEFAAFGALLAIALTALFLVGLIERRDQTRMRLGYDSWTAILLYMAGIAVLYTIRPAA